jgi:uncharacterized protein (TIGR03032 family)
MEEKASEDKKAKFNISYPEEIAQILKEERVNLVLSTYQAGKLIFIGPSSSSQLSQTPVSFKKPMGIASGKNIIGIASLDRVEVFTNHPGLAKAYPGRPNHFDTMFFPRTTYHTGMLDLHDLHWTSKGLIAVNTRYSCLCRFDYRYNFSPFWKPSFISELVPEDRCHLNGLAMRNGSPAYVTALGSGNIKESWRNGIERNGILIDIENNEVILEGLCMPHSPRLHNGSIYLLESGNGNLVKFNLLTREKELVCHLSGFARGLAFTDNYAFIGMSKIREESKTAKVLPVSKLAQESGVVLVDLKTNEIIGKIKYEGGIDEIYDLQIIENTSKAALVTNTSKSANLAVASPDLFFWRTPQKEKPEEAAEDGHVNMNED